MYQATRTKYWTETLPFPAPHYKVEAAWENLTGSGTRAQEISPGAPGAWWATPRAAHGALRAPGPIGVAASLVAGGHAHPSHARALSRGRAEPRDRRGCRMGARVPGALAVARPSAASRDRAPKCPGPLLAAEKQQKTL